MKYHEVSWNSRFRGDLFSICTSRPLFLVLLRSAGASHHFSEEGIHWWTPTRGFLSHGGYHQIIQNLTILILKPFETIETYGFGEPPILRNLQLIKDLVIVRGNIHWLYAESTDNPSDQSTTQWLIHGLTHSVMDQLPYGYQNGLPTRYLRHI